MIKSLALVLFAAIMAGTAVYAPDHAKGRSTSTGKDGTIPIIFTDYAKKYSNSGVASDCQGFYFYVTPVDPLQMKEDSSLNYFPESAETLFEGSLARTDVRYVDENGNEKNRTFREYFEKEKEIDEVRYRWIQDYNIARFQGYTSVIPQTHESLLFVPYATWTGVWNNSGSDNNQGALKSGWKNNISRICYYKRDASNLKERYRSENDKKYLDNRVFLTQDVYHNVRDNKMSEFESLCKNGIFYTELAKLAVNKENADVEKNATELIEVNKLWERFKTPEKVRSFVNNSDLQNKSAKLWDYILTLNTSNNSLTFNGPSRIDDFLTLGYNNYYGKRNAAYSASNPIGMNLSKSEKFKLEKWESASPADELFVNNEFAQLEYNLHYLDLMLTIYAVSLKQGASSEVQNAWENAFIIKNDPKCFRSGLYTS